MNRILLPTKTLKALALFVSHDESKYPLMHILLELRTGKNVLGIATNRKVMAVYRHADIIANIDADLLVPVWPLRFFQKNEITLHWDDKTLIFSAGQIALHTDRNISLQFPRWRKVLPKKSMAPGGMPSAFNGELMGRFTKAGKILRNKTELMFLGSEETEAVAVFLNEPNFYGLIMPMITAISLAKPNWIHDDTQSVSNAGPTAT